MGHLNSQKGIMILGAGVMQIPMIMKARDLGLFVIASDMDPNAPGFKIADYALKLDTRNARGHIAFALANRERFNIRGVVAGADVALTAAMVSEALGFPGIPVEVALRSNNKWLMKKRWLKDGIPTPYAEEVSTLPEALKAVRKVGLPCMVKAIDNAASRGSRRIGSINELEAALKDAREHSTTKTALIEEYVKGTEQSVEMMVYNGMHLRFGIVDRHFGFDPFPIELGHTNPSRLAPDMQESLYGLVTRAAGSLGIDYGPYKADTILTKKGPMMLELPARLSGGFHSQYTTPLSTGLEPQIAAIAMAVGTEIPLEAIKTTHSRVAVCKAVFPRPGRVVKIRGFEEAKSLPGVEKIFMMVKEGTVVHEYRNCAHRVCYIIATGDSFNEAEINWTRASKKVEIITVVDYAAAL
ncbi:MAG: ATP-grasp domain-containing protein [Deltaproteobacteria bacterium]|nr:ATP-grasp domain-containing protein [Deltaproteobacteria bacterium]